MAKPPNDPSRGGADQFLPPTWRGRRGLWRLVLLLAIVAGIVRVCTVGP